MTDIEFKKEMKKRFKKWYEMDKGGKYSDIDNYDLVFDKVIIHTEHYDCYLSYKEYILESLFGPDFIKFLNNETWEVAERCIDNY